MTDPPLHVPAAPAGLLRFRDLYPALGIHDTLGSGESIGMVMGISPGPDVDGRGQVARGSRDRIKTLLRARPGRARGRGRPRPRQNRKAES